MSKLIPLSMWAKRRYENPPSSRTLRRWTHEQRIDPMPEKHGRAYYVLEHAAYWEPGTKPRLIDRVFPNWREEDDEEDADGYLPSKTPWVLQIREDRKHKVLPLDQLRGLPEVTLATAWSGVYFLWRKAELVYVGEAVNIYRRIREHRWEGKRFTRATSMYFQPKSTMEVEARYVAHYRPRLNRTRQG